MVRGKARKREKSSEDVVQANIHLPLLYVVPHVSFMGEWVSRFRCENLGFTWMTSAGIGLDQISPSAQRCCFLALRCGWATSDSFCPMLTGLSGKESAANRESKLLALTTHVCVGTNSVRFQVSREGKWCDLSGLQFVLLPNPACFHFSSVSNDLPSHLDYPCKLLMWHGQQCQIVEWVFMSGRRYSI